MTKIILKTSGIKVAGRKREPDIDHASAILDYVRRGYTVNAADEVSFWSISYLWSDGRLFVNQPEHTSSVLREYLNYGHDNGAEVDVPVAEWCSKLARLVASITPPTIYISRNVNLTPYPGDTHD
jgi:hypothetical protein